jgi:TrwC relaxase
MEPLVVATIAAGATAQYYSKQSEYYLGGRGAAGCWISVTNHFGVINGGTIDNTLFERLHAGVDKSGQPLLTNSGDVTKRVAGTDLSLSAPKSVSIIFALADDQTRRAIETAARHDTKAKGASACMPPAVVTGAGLLMACSGWSGKTFSLSKKRQSGFAMSRWH